MSNWNGSSWKLREVGEMDSMMFRLDDEAEFGPLGKESTTDAFISSLRSTEKFRKPLVSVLQELVDDTSVTGLPINVAHARSSFKFRNSESVRLIVDLWSNSNETELRQTVSAVRSLFKQFKNGFSVDTLACVYPAPENRRAYSALRNSIIFGESRFYGITHAPRIENHEYRCDAILGLRSGLFAFLST